VESVFAIREIVASHILHLLALRYNVGETVFPFQQAPEPLNSRTYRRFSIILSYLQEENLGIERLGKIPVSPALHRVNGIGDAAVTSENDDGHPGLIR